ncbi:hypothetical protein CONCODRAFT_79694 [Conidiobolus coronatus NRRL 28638]|uniref:C2H2-type domain-containing protein n=1 Tax=Conidiobolus coronatus (strain ATCC 28846 / CBS 209.66 / NRRL 28638) TaxID=796925 RepID=A0A137P0I1_CONC2|nr:hypothetical protein CONCODRAFT_79694 [Conidiobolus coronatus NRRL 28638]|eukprot:KXN68600.1 hypothetical protein CONCODRAFT_79694 [Conidiobolus coronatus NRRL 28638]
MSSNNNNDDLANNDNNDNNNNETNRGLKRSQLNPKAAPFIPRMRSITQPISQVSSLPGNFQSPLVFPNQLNRLDYAHIQSNPMISPEGLDMVSPPISPGVDPYWLHFGFPHYIQHNTYPYPPNPQSFYTPSFTPSIDQMPQSSLGMFAPITSQLPSVPQQTGSQFSGLGVYPNSNPQYAPNRLFPLKSNVSQDSELVLDIEPESIQAQNISDLSSDSSLPATSANTNNNTASNLETIPETPEIKPVPRPRAKTRRTSHSSEVEHKDSICPFEGCGRPFKRPEHLKRHIMSIHHKEKPHQCPFPGCGKCFSRNDNLTQHIKSHSKQGVQNRKRNFTR